MAPHADSARLKRIGTMTAKWNSLGNPIDPPTSFNIYPTVQGQAKEIGVLYARKKIMTRTLHI